ILHIFEPARQLGVYWRRRMIAACRRSSHLQTNFIIRRAFSGARRTIELDPVQARAEFIQNIINADFVLAPKGDGNYSNRFLEALSLGRIPIVPDTDIVLPLEGSVDYSFVMVRVPMNRVCETPKYIHEFYDALTEVEWQQRQQLVREIFEKYLRQDSFFRYFFVEVLPTLS
ncbi:MAG: exostosin family protein, partial [Minisyncoccia bacterium]